MQNFNDDLKNRLRAISAREMLNHGVIVKAKKFGYICPFCGNGSGKDGTGIKPTDDNGTTRFHCFRCDKIFDNLTLLANYFHLDEKGKADFPEIISRGAEMFGLTAGAGYIPVRDSREQSKKETPETPPGVISRPSWQSSTDSRATSLPRPFRSGTV